MANAGKAVRPVVLIIRDGWGISPSPRDVARQEGNAVALARTPVHDELLAKYPWAALGASGEAVGLPHGQMGNSEVGHLNLGAGRIVYQDFTRISKAIDEGEFYSNPAFLELIGQVNARSGRLHLMGLVSDGGVHSHIHHLLALLELARRHQVGQVLIHCITDGRDTSPTSGADFAARVTERCGELHLGRIATVIGRYFAMDRDNRWERVAQAYDAIARGRGVLKSDPVAAVREWYAQAKTDEFIPPTVIARDAAEAANNALRDGDGVIFFNFRSDRAREITRAITDKDFNAFDRGRPANVDFVCMTEYDETFKLPVAFPSPDLTNILAQVLAQHGKKQLRIAETEKYAHVTFFFNGGMEQPVAGEDRCLIPSPKVATYDLKPEMSAPEVTEQALARVASGQYDLIVLNFANGDMVGHTGVVEAAVKAVETVDTCVGRVVQAVLKAGGAALVTADHGNAEQLLDENRSPFTAHTTNRVHFIYVAADAAQWRVREGILADVAPTILMLLGLAVPKEMTGKSLLERR